MINEKFLQNTGAVRDLCQDVCFEIDELSNMEVFNNKDKEELKSLYKKAKETVDKITELGFFNKSLQTKNTKEILSLVNNILDVEKKANKYAAIVWNNEITKVEDFDQQDFKLCVKRLPYDLKNLDKNIKEAFNEKSCVYFSTLISNQNVVTNLNSIESEAETSFPFGIVYSLSEKSFVMASDTSTSYSLKTKETEVNNMQTEDFGDIKACIKGSAVKIKTPNQIIDKNLKNPLYVNNNVVVLNATHTKPAALFYCGYNIKKVNLLKRKLSFIAKKMGIPLININLLKHYQNNKNYFESNSVSRKVFNEYVDFIAKDLNLYCKYDFKSGAKRLIGLNNNLRYNFIFKFSRNINSLIEGKDFDEADTADYVVDMYLKAIEKHNLLTKKREKANGGPLFFPDDSVFIALPKDFLKEE